MARDLMRMSLSLVLVISMPLAAQAVSWNGGGDGTNWSDPDNWGGTAPAHPEDAVIDPSTSTTVVLSSDAGFIDQLQMGGTAGVLNTLHLMPGANLQMANYSRVGRNGDNNGDFVKILISGGSFQQAANDLHLGWDATSPESIVVEITGGTFDAFDEFRVGQNDLDGGQVEFYVNGSGGTVTVGELELVDNPNNDTWKPALHFTIDAGGVAPITVDGMGNTGNGTVKFDINSTLLLDVASASAPNSLTLVSALLVSGNQSALMDAGGTVINAGDTISAGLLGGQEYLYDLYYDSAYDGTGTPGVYLTNLQVVPEPASAVLMGLLGLGLVCLRGKRS